MLSLVVQFNQKYWTGQQAFWGKDIADFNVPKGLFQSTHTNLFSLLFAFKVTKQKHVFHAAAPLGRAPTDLKTTKKKQNSKKPDTATKPNKQQKKHQKTTNAPKTQTTSMFPWAMSQQPSQSVQAEI